MNCRQCAKNECVEPWVICGECSKKNVKYEEAIDAIRRANRGLSFGHYTATNRLATRESRGRKTRPVDVLVHDEYCDETNTRTHYHGGNYADE